MSGARLAIHVLLLVSVGYATPAWGQDQDEEYRRVGRLGLDALEDRRLDDAIAAFKRCLELSAKDQVCAYNLACAYSLKREVRAGLDWLDRSIEWGFDDLAHMEKDSDLDNLRGEPRYLALLRRMKGVPDAGTEDAGSVLRTTELIVMIEGRLAGGPTIGAGIIFGRRDDQIYVATARHTVRRGDLEATDLRLKLKSSAAEPLTARLTEHSDLGVDLAVLTATLPAGRAALFCRSVPVEVLGDSDEVHRGDPVYPVGYPNGAPWGIPVAPDRVAQLVGDDITFQSSFIAGGHSGGGVITEEGKLVGMIKADTPPFGVAVRITRVLQALRQWGYPVYLRAPSNFLRTPLHQAIAKRDVGAVRSLLGECAHVNTMDASGRTPLHLAADLGWTDGVRLLVGAGADVRARTRGSKSEEAHSRTALHLAAARGSAPVAELLIAGGADVNAKALDFADREWAGTPLHEAAAAGAVGVMDALLRGGAEINAPSIDGTPLAWAVRRQAAAAAKLLIARGADVNASAGGELPLYIAADTGAEEMTKLLLAGRADPNLSGPFGQPLHRAARHGNVAIVRLLLDAGASPTAETGRGVTPIELAEEGGHQAVVNLLRERAKLQGPAAKPR